MKWDEDWRKKDTFLMEEDIHLNKSVTLDREKKTLKKVMINSENLNEKNEK